LLSELLNIPTAPVKQILLYLHESTRDYKKYVRGSERLEQSVADKNILEATLDVVFEGIWQFGLQI